MASPKSASSQTLILDPASHRNRPLHSRSPCRSISNSHHHKPCTADPSRTPASNRYSLTLHRHTVTCLPVLLRGILRCLLMATTVCHRLTWPMVRHTTVSTTTGNRTRGTCTDLRHQHISSHSTASHRRRTPRTAIHQRPVSSVNLPTVLLAVTATRTRCTSKHKDSHCLARSMASLHLRHHCNTKEAAETQHRLSRLAKGRPWHADIVASARFDAPASRTTRTTRAAPTVVASTRSACTRRSEHQSSVDRIGRPVGRTLGSS